MSAQIARKNPPPARRLARCNTMAFPRELRDAIPDVHTGRVLELDAITGHATNAPWFGPSVELKLRVKETGKLSGKFVVRMSLQIEAARTLAETLVDLAGQASTLTES